MRIESQANVERLTPVALFQWGPTEVRVQLFRERDCINLRRSIAAGRIKVQTRSLKAPVFGAHLSEPRHVFASDQSAEQQRVSIARRESEFWARMI